MTGPLDRIAAALQPLSPAIAETVRDLAKAYRALAEVGL